MKYVVRWVNDISSGDFNGDDKVDLLILTSNRVYVYPKK